MGALLPLLDVALNNFKIESSSLGGRFFVNNISLLPGKREELETLLRKSAHWEGGRKELSQSINILLSGSKKSHLLVMLMLKPSIRQCWRKSGESIGPVLHFIENAHNIDNVSPQGVQELIRYFQWHIIRFI